MKDDELVELFFSENKQEIEDNGFSEQVMKSLPYSSWTAYRIWTIAGSIAAVVLFVVSGGFNWLKLLYYSLVGNTAGWIASLHFSMPTIQSFILIYVALLTLVFVGCYNVYLSAIRK